MKETIRVTQADIDRAREEINRAMFPSWAHMCPIAQAIKRQYSARARAGEWDMCRQDGEGNALWAVTPEDVRPFMSAFDHNEPVEPFEFKVEWWANGSA